MSHYRLHLLPAVLGLCAVALAATPALAAAPGTYKGPGDPNGRIKVVTGENAVSRATVDWRVPCDNGNSFSAEDLSFRDMAIARGRFKRGGEVLYPLGGFTLAEGKVKLKGRFVSKRKVRLTFTADIRIDEGGETIDRCRGTIRFVARRPR